MSDLTLLVIGFGIFASCMLATIGMVIGTSQAPDPEQSESVTLNPKGKSE